MSNVYTNMFQIEGFGATYQKIIETYLFCVYNNLNFGYRPIKKMEHNYKNDPNYINNIESLMNLKNNIENDTNNVAQDIHFGKYIQTWFDDNIDQICNEVHLKFIKKCFWENKDRNVFKNNKKNIALHIRRENSHDRGHAGARITTPNEYYLNIMNGIRNKYKEHDKELLFHIYSQGEMNNFAILQKEDVIFHLDEDICKTFTELVAADILLTSPSSLSYVAALISDGEIYYKQFWHKPRKEWIISID